MKVVPDASVLANALADAGTEGETARKLLDEAQETIMPDVANVECAAVLRKRWAAGLLDDTSFARAVDELIEFPAERYSTTPMLRRVFELRHNVAAYDACYIALAETFGCEVLTADARLARAPGVKCPVRLVNQSKG